MSDEPVCLIQWLKPEEDREVATAWAKFGASINLHVNDVTTKAEVVAAIDGWLTDNSNSQFLYIGAHGVHDAQGRCVGLGKDGADVLSWNELATALRRAKIAPAVWLGACRSSAVASAWTPIAGVPPAASITTFDDPIKPTVCQQMLRQALDDTSINNIVFLDEELPRLQKAVGAANVEQYYPALRLDKVAAYVSVTRFQQEVGLSFRAFLKRRW